MRPVIVQRAALYIDQQALPPAAFCPQCGGSLYLPGLECIRCQRRRL